MSKQTKSDVLVVGMGMAGLMAAYTAAQKGKNVCLLGTGLGALSIASGCIDALGYIPQTQDTAMQAVQKPMEALSKLAPQHPYNIMGREQVEKAFDAMQLFCKEQGADFLAQGQKNTLVPTIIGTLKPTYIYPAASDSAPLFAAKRVLVASVDAIRDCHPQLIKQQLQKYPALKDTQFSTASLPSHFGAAHRAVSPLDVARYVDTLEGFTWLYQALTPYAKEVDAILIPPILGAGAHRHGGKKEPSPWKKLQEKLHLPVVEMLSLPPGVGGNRLLSLLLQAVRSLGVRIIENATISHAELQNGHCTALISCAQGQATAQRFEAKSFILATGGVLGGGIVTKPGMAHESIFNIKLETPQDQEAWAEQDPFASHAFTQMGVRVNEKLQPLTANNTPLADNVYFAGRSLGGYDFAAEKSGNGVALATAWYAAQHI